jgi:dTDP-4-dehydrorhamnose reductase
MLGHEVVQAFESAFDLHVSVRDQGTARRGQLGGVLHHFDVGAQSVEALLSEVRPAVVINCIGLIKQLPDGSRPVSAIRINSLFPHQVAEACVQTDARFIQISTDCVYSGDLPAPQKYSERDFPDPRDVYGRTKLLGEVADGRALTLRTSIIGWELGRTTGLLEWFAAQAGRRVRGFTSAIFSGLTTRAFARILRQLVEEHKTVNGLYHVSADAIDKYSLLMMLREALELDCEIVPDDGVRLNRALDSSQFKAETNIAVPSWVQMIDEYVVGKTHASA